MESPNDRCPKVRLEHWSPSQIDGKRVAVCSLHPASRNPGRILRGRLRALGTPDGAVVILDPEGSVGPDLSGSVCLEQHEVDRLVPASRGLPFEFLCFA